MELLEIKKTLENSPDLYHLIEAEALYNEILLEFKKPFDLEVDKKLEREIENLESKVKFTEKELTAIGDIDIKSDSIKVYTTDLNDSINYKEVLVKMQEEIATRLKFKKTLTPRNKKDPKNHVNDKLMTKKVVMSIQHQVKDYKMYKQRRIALSKLPYGLQLVYNDLSYILTACKQYNLEEWYGFDITVSTSIDFVNIYTNQFIKFILVEESIKMIYNSEEFDATFPVYIGIANLLQITAIPFSTQKMTIA